MKKKRFAFMAHGQAMITAIFVVIIGMLVTTGAVYALLNNTLASSEIELGALAYGAAESGLENGILRTILEPNYTGETWEIAPGQTVTITVAGTSPQVITAEGKAGTITRRLQATMQYNSTGVLSVIWKEPQ